MSKLPRLDDLVWLPVQPGHDADWVLDGPCLSVDLACGDNGQEKVYALLLATVCPFGGEVSGTTRGEMRAWRARDDEIPAPADDRQAVPGYVVGAPVVGR
jgi:hypothetical protein